MTRLSKKLQNWFAGLAHGSGLLGVIDANNRPDAGRLKGGCMRYLILVLLLASPAFSAEPVYSWRTRADDPDRAYLYRDGQQIGGWDYRAKQYRGFDGTNWGSPAGTAPVQPPEQRVLVFTPPKPTVIPQQVLPPFQPRAHGRIGPYATVSQGFSDIFEYMLIDAMPRAIAYSLIDSLKRGDYRLEYRSSVTPPPQQSKGQTTPPSLSQPAQSSQRR